MLAPVPALLVEPALLDAVPLEEDTTDVEAEIFLSPFVEEEDDDDEEAVEVVLLAFFDEVLWLEEVSEELFEDAEVEDEDFWAEDVVAPLWGSKPDPSSVSIMTSSSVIATSFSKNSSDEV